MPWPLVWRYLLSHPLRSALTMASIVVATFLLCVLRSVIGALDAGIDAAAANRLIVQSAVSLFVELPHAYQPKIEAVEGIATSCKLSWFGGRYATDEDSFFAQFAVDPERLLDLYPELEIVDGTAQDFIARRNGCLVGRVLAEEFRWKVGDTVPIQGTIFARSDGTAWEFEVQALYDAPVGAVDQRTLYFHHEYLDQALELEAAEGPDGVGVYAVRVETGSDPVTVMAEIDALFENGPQVVQTTTEREFNRQFVSMFGSVPTLLNSIGMGVLFAILLAAVNTMVMAGRERTRDLGVLKALGFGDGTVFALLLAESVFLCLVAGALGVGLAVMSESGMPAMLTMMFPGYAVSSEVRILGLVVAALLGIVAGVVPAWHAMRLRPVAALRAEV